MKQKIGFIFGTTLFLLFLSIRGSVVWAGNYNTDSNGVAIKGYDSVAYFERGEAVRGKSDYRYEWSGVKWYFASSAAKDKFVAHPQKYAPQYGGYCAYAVSRGSKADSDPTVWTIVEGKLYLNLNASVKSLWERDRDNNIKNADNLWKNLQ